MFDLNNGNLPSDKTIVHSPVWDIVQESMLAKDRQDLVSEQYWLRRPGKSKKKSLLHNLDGFIFENGRSVIKDTQNYYRKSHHHHYQFESENKKPGPMLLHTNVS